MFIMPERSWLAGLRRPSELGNRWETPPTRVLESRLLVHGRTRRKERSKQWKNHALLASDKEKEGGEKKKKKKTTRNDNVTYLLRRTLGLRLSRLDSKCHMIDGLGRHGEGRCFLWDMYLRKKKLGSCVYGHPRSIFFSFFFFTIDGKGIVGSDGSKYKGKDVRTSIIGLY